MGICTALALFLKPLHWFVKFNYLLLHITNIFFGFSHCDGWLIWNLVFVFPHLYFCETVSHGWISSCSKLWIWMGIYFRYSLLIIISRGTSNCDQHVFEEKKNHNDIPIQYFCDFFKQKIKRINNAQLFSQPSLITFTKNTNNSEQSFNLELHLGYMRKYMKINMKINVILY